jgi:hypothetical protein
MGLILYTPMNYLSEPSFNTPVYMYTAFSFGAPKVPTGNEWDIHYSVILRELTRLLPYRYTFVRALCPSPLSEPFVRALCPSPFHKPLGKYLIQTYLNNSFYHYLDWMIRFDVSAPTLGTKRSTSLPNSPNLRSTCLSEFASLLVPLTRLLYRGHNFILQEDDIFLASWEHSKWLVLSSSFFLFPSMYAFYHHLYLHSFLLFSTSFISANYWRKPTFSWRRTLDLFFSKFSFSWFFLHGVFYIHSTPHLIFALSNACLFSSCFLLSSHFFYKHQDTWYIFHFLFHTLMTFQQYHILYHILLSNNSLV